MFNLFDPEGELRITTGRLPHWYQPEATYFVTFRTDDSIPAERLNQWRMERTEWLKREGLDPDQTDWTRLPPNRIREFRNRFDRAFHEMLDRGHGACHLREPEIATLVGNSVRHFDRIRYDVDSFVVMPNHVHVLLGLIGETEIEAATYSWKKFAVTKINRHLGMSGRFWQEESFDHLVRSPEQFEYIRNYIRDNPKEASLKAGEFLYYERPSETE